jgi:hypothetical protein
VLASALGRAHIPLARPSTPGARSKVDAVLAQLPSANANVLRMLLEVCHYAARNAADTEMDALVGAASCPGVIYLCRGPRALNRACS